jgi:Zn-dependent protease
MSAPNRTTFHSKLPQGCALRKRTTSSSRKSSSTFGLYHPCYNQFMLGLSPIVFITRIITLVISLTFHEFSHAYVANKLGDDTPRMNGRLTLNPLAHLDIIGSLMLIVAGFGWAKPVPVNGYALRQRSPSALMWVSLAGPASNFILAIVAAIPLRLGLISLVPSTMVNFVYSLIAGFIQINLLLMVFNLIPIAPLDGEKIAEYFLPPSWARKLENIAPYGPMILMAILFVLPMLGINILGAVMYPVINTLFTLLVGGPA